MNYEVRWFIEGSYPDEIGEWQANKGFMKEKKRSDIYLIFPSPEIGVKLREGRLEIKYRLAYDEFTSLSNRFSGKMEFWKKTSIDLSDPIANPFQNVDDYLFAVEKERAILRFQMDPLSGKLATVKGKIDLGVIIESTKLTIQGSNWWTLGFDAFGEREIQKECLLNGIPLILMDFPLPKLQLNDSMSYPQWLLSLG